MLLQVTPLHSSLAAPVVPLLANQSANACWFPAPSHSTVKSEACAVIVGSVVSSIVKVAVVVLEFPQASVAVKITVAKPVSPHPSLSAVKLLLQVTPLQSSLAAPVDPLLANQSAKACWFPAPSHSTVKSEAFAVIVGSVVSSIVKSYNFV